jgi:hypothetical protein
MIWAKGFPPNIENHSQQGGYQIPNHSEPTPTTKDEWLNGMWIDFLIFFLLYFCPNIINNNS